MTSITQHLPWPIKDLGVAIIGQECYGSLVENLHLGDVQCLKLALSKGLGIGIVAGGAIMKVPQILLITSARSARGLSLESYALETLAYGINLAYSVRHAFPFTTYGENLFLTFQNITITLLIILLGPRPHHRTSSPDPLALAGVLLAASALTLAMIPLHLLALLQLGSLPLGLASKLPQIRQNARAKGTGQLSAFAVGAQIAGCLARVYTTALEVGDALVLAGYVLALVLNGVLALQIWMYWPEEDDLEAGRTGEKTSGHASPAWGVGTHGSPTPPPASPPRKFTRKVI